jgi:hypothetical protein
MGIGLSEGLFDTYKSPKTQQLDIPIVTVFAFPELSRLGRVAI